MGVVGSRHHGAVARELGPLLEDLAVLCDGPGLTVRLGRDLGGVTLKSGGRLLYVGKGGRAWKRVTRRTRTQLFMSWVRDAASIARSRLLMGRAEA
jgi:hypothetical protein